jgi:hypothetical protein
MMSSQNKHPSHLRLLSELQQSLAPSPDSQSLLHREYTGDHNTVNDPHMGPAGWSWETSFLRGRVKDGLDTKLGQEAHGGWYRTSNDVQSVPFFSIFSPVAIAQGPSQLPAGARGNTPSNIFHPAAVHLEAVGNALRVPWHE